MILLVVVLAVIVFAAAYRVAVWKPARALHSSDVQCSERHAAQTEDGILLALYRFRPKTIRGHHPIVMCHGMSVNRFHFDNGTDLSLARFFRDAGFDVWLMELRGCGNSTPVPIWIPDSRFDFDHFAAYDVPTVIDYVRHQTGSDRVHWLGHSMGGMVWVGAAALGMKLNCISATLIAAAVDFSCWTLPRNRKWWRVFYRFSSLFPTFPGGILARIFFPVLPHVVRKLRYPTALARILNLDNMNPLHRTQFFANAISNLPRGLILQTISWVMNGRMASRDDSVNYTDGLKNIECPVHIVASAHDVSIPIATIRAGFDYAVVEDKTYTVLEPSSVERTEFGHADMIYSPACYTEFFPQLLSWLRTRDVDRADDTQ